MAVPAAAAEKFPQSICRDSLELVTRIGARRVRFADLRDEHRRQQGIEHANMVRVYEALLKEAA